MTGGGGIRIGRVATRTATKVEEFRDTVSGALGLGG